MAENAPDQEVFDLDPFDTVVAPGDDSDLENDSDDGDDPDDLSDTLSDNEDNMDQSELPLNVVYIQEMAKKLDAILTLVFEHFHQNYTSITTSGTLQLPPPLPELPPLDSPSSPFLTAPFTQKPPPAPPSLPDPSSPLPTESSVSPGSSGRRKPLLRTQFLTLLTIFDLTILRTFKSRYTQFLVFWYTSLDPEFADIFQGMLVERALFEFTSDGLTRTTTSVVTRAAAASYIGSFVSRATFVDKEGTRRIVGVLCEFIKAHLEGIQQLAVEGAVEDGLGLSQNTVFYAVSQAVFLIFCFRWRDLLEEQQHGDELLAQNADKVRNKWIPELSILQRAVTSLLNPLMVRPASFPNKGADIYFLHPGMLDECGHAVCPSSARHRLHLLLYNLGVQQAF